MQDFTGRPFQSTVQQPQRPMTQPTWAPVSPSTSRRKWMSNRRGSISARRSAPFTVTAMRTRAAPSGESTFSTYRPPALLSATRDLRSVCSGQAPSLSLWGALALRRVDQPPDAVARVRRLPNPDAERRQRVLDGVAERAWRAERAGLAGPLGAERRERRRRLQVVERQRRHVVHGRQQVVHERRVELSVLVVAQLLEQRAADALRDAAHVLRLHDARVQHRAAVVDADVLHDL